MNREVNPADSQAVRYLGVAEQRFEAKIHVLLNMAVKQREARLIGDHIHGGASKCGNDYRVLHNTGGRLAIELDDLEQMPVHVHWVRIVSAIVKHEPVAPSLTKHEFP